MADSIYKYISTLTGDVQAQINTITGGGPGPVDASHIDYHPTTPGNWPVVPSDVKGALDELAANALATPISEANGGLGSNTSALTAGLLTKTATNTYASRSLAAGAGISITNPAGTAGNPSVAIDSTVATLTGSQTLTNKTISGASNTLSNIANASLTNSSVSYPAGTGLTGGGTVSLGGSATAFAVSYGTTAGTAAQGNDSRFATIPSVPLSEANGGLGSDTSALAAGLLTKTATNTYATRSVVGGTGISVTNGAGTAGNPSVAIDSTVATLTGSQTLTNKTISGASNTLSNIANASLTNSSITIGVGTGLTGGGAVSLGGTSTNLAVSYGTTAGTAAQGNDSRFSTIPTVPISKANGGFGQDVSTGLTNDQVAIVSGNAITIGALTTAAVPNLSASKITSGQIAEAQGGLGSDTSALSAGLLTKTATNTYASRSLTAPAAGITITNPAGTAGSPTFVLANDLAAVEGLSGTGLAVRTATDTWTNRSLAAGTGTTVTNGDGVSGNLSVNVTYGTASSTATQGNDTRLPPTPTAAGKILYDTGSAYAESAAGTSGQGLVSGGAGAPTWGERGGAGPKFWLNTAGSWATNGYLGIADDGSSTVNVNVVPWIVPCAGTLKNLRVFGFQAPSGSTVITIYKATAAASPSYASTALTCTVASGTNTASDTTHSVSVSAGDLIVAFCSAFWATNGCSVSTQFVPT